MEDPFNESSPLEQELEALSAIYIEELTVHRNPDGQVKEVSLLLHPATGDDTTKQFVCINLIFHPTEKYPDEVPAISVRNPRGLGQEEMSSLVEDMKLKAEESKGEMMLYTLIEMAKDSLTEGNIPHSPCIVCLEHFEEGSSFQRTACYHYFHTLCLHKYLEHVRAQQAAEEADDAQRGVLHQKDGSKRKEKEVICPLCRCPLDQQSLAIHCVEVDEDDQEAFTPSPALRVQQQEMAARFEKQKAQGGIIDLEWEKNKYLINSEDRTPFRASPDLSTNTSEKDKGTGQDPQMNDISDDKGDRRQSPHAIIFHGSKRSDDRRQNQSYRHGDNKGQGRVSRGFRDKYRNSHNTRENEKQGRTPTDRYNSSYQGFRDKFSNTDKDVATKSKGHADLNRSIEEESEVVVMEDNDRLCSREIGGRYNNARDRRDTGQRGRGRGRFRGGSSCEYGDDYNMRRDDRVSSADSESCRLSPNDYRDTDEANERNAAANVHRNTHYQYSDDRRDYRQDQRSHRPRGRGRGKGRGSDGRPRYDTENSDSTFRGNDQYEDHGRERYSDRHNVGFDKGKSQRGKRHPQRGRYHSHSFPEEPFRSHGELNHQRREREETGSKHYNSRRSNMGRKNVVNSAATGENIELDDDNDSEGDKRNLEINQRWRRMNYSSSNKHGEPKADSRKFGVIDDNEHDRHNRIVREEDVSSEESDYEEIPKPNPNYTAVNGQLDHYYPGFDQALEQESWEDEIDPYAPEIRKYRGEQLKKYKNTKKSENEYFAAKLKERVKNENLMDEELRRIRKEQEEKRSNSDRRESEELQSGQLHRGSLSVLEQFKQKEQGNGKSGFTQVNPPNNQHNLHKQELDASAVSTAVSYDSASTERLHSDRRQKPSHEDLYAKTRDETFTEKEKHLEKDLSHRAVSAKDIKWRGRKTPNHHQPALLPSEEQCGSENGMNEDVYKDAWDRRSALDKKARQDRRKKKKEMSYPKENSTASKETSHYKNSEKSEHGMKVSYNAQKRQTEKRGQKNFDDQGSRTGRRKEILTDKISAEMPGHVLASQNDSFKKPKPLDLRRSNNCPSSASKKSANEMNTDAESERSDSQSVVSSQSKSFIKPKPVDFRRGNSSSMKDKASHNPRNEITSDAPL